MSRPTLLLAALGLSTTAWASNPFASAGSYGVGEGWRTFPGKVAGDAIRRDGDTLRMDDSELEQISACTDEFIPASGRMMATGRWKYAGIESDDSWKGGRLRVYFFDGAGKRLKGEQNQPQLAFGKGSADWTDIDQTVVVPDSAVKARLCAELVYTTAGSMWLDDVELSNLAVSDADSGKNVLWILVDTLRADHVGTYGGNPAATPNIDALAEQGLIYDRAWTQYTWTVPSTISFFTSQFARTHGWNSTFEKVAAGDYTEMGDEVPTVAQVLRDQGYITSAHYANGLLKAGIGVGRGFLDYRHGNDEEVVKRSIADIGLWDGDGGPNFLYMHLMTPHIPLRPTGAAQAAVGVSLDTPADGFRYYEGDYALSMTQDAYHQVFQDAYTASVFDADRYVAQVLAALEDAGHADDTIVVLTSDHGEMLGEHGAMGHGSYVYEGVTSVPLILRAPGRQAQRVQDRVGRSIDIAPTILDWLGLDAEKPSGWQGMSLFDAAPGIIAVAERDYQVAFTTDGQWKLVENRDSDEFVSSFDLQADPGELNSLGPDGGAELSALDQEADAWRKATPEPGQEELATRKVIEKTDQEKDEELEMLRALGYME